MCKKILTFILCINSISLFGQSIEQFSYERIKYPDSKSYMPSLSVLPDINVRYNVAFPLQNIPNFLYSLSELREEGKDYFKVEPYLYLFQSNSDNRVNIYEDFSATSIKDLAISLEGQFLFGDLPAQINNSHATRIIQIDQNYYHILQSAVAGLDVNEWDPGPNFQSDYRTYSGIFDKELHPVQTSILNSDPNIMERQAASFLNNGIEVIYLENPLKQSFSVGQLNNLGIKLYDYSSGAMKSIQLDNSLSTYLSNQNSVTLNLDTIVGLSSNLFLIRIFHGSRYANNGDIFVLFNRAGEIISILEINFTRSFLTLNTRIGKDRFLYLDRRYRSTSPVINLEYLVRQVLFSAKIEIANNTEMTSTLLENSIVSGILNSSDQVEILDTFTDHKGRSWLYIDNSSGNFGWIPADAVDWSTIRFPNDEQLTDPEIQERIREVSGQ
jgi:hypothetical protein